MNNEFDEWMLQNIPTILGLIIIIATLLNLVPFHLSGILRITSLASSLIGKAMDVIYKVPGMEYLVARR